MTVKKCKNHHGAVLDSIKGFDVIDCEVCGFKHIIPIPTPDELIKVYQQEYYSKEKPCFIQNASEDLEWWNIVYKERYDLFEKLLPKSRRKIFDVGTGPGNFLLYGRDHGWDVSGIEPSKQAAEYGKQRGLNIINDFLDENTAKGLGTFDVVHASEVFEHLPDPQKMASIISGLLNPGGLACIVVPNDYNPIQDVLRKSGFAPWWVAPPHHINYFDPKSCAHC
jgi:SAM-dependent methyltransferase